MVTEKVIYALRNPLEDNSIFYIGQSKDAWKRLLNHIRDASLNKYPYHETILKICKAGVMPTLEILETIKYNPQYNNSVNAEMFCKRERFWISQYANQLKNIANNGFGKLVSKSRKCNHCGNEYVYQKPSSKYCSEICRVYFSREKKATKKPETPQIKDFTQPTNEVPNLTKEPPKSNYTIPAVNKDEILKQISELEEKIETIPHGQYYNKLMQLYKGQIRALQNELKK